MTEPDWTPSALPHPDNSLPAFSYFGGSGYGVQADGFFIGGFGLVLFDYGIGNPEQWNGTTTQNHAMGGVGGILLGSRIFGDGDFHFDVGARLGLGGLVAWQILTAPTSDFFLDSYTVGYVEPYLELGVGPTRWLHLTVNLGYPMLGNIAPGKPFSDAFWGSPSLGFGVYFGSFSL